MWHQRDDHGAGACGPDGSGGSFEPGSPGGSVRPQDLQQEVRVDLGGVDPAALQVQHAADGLLLRVQRRDVGGWTAQVQLGVGAWRWPTQSGEEVFEVPLKTELT